MVEEVHTEVVSEREESMPGPEEEEVLGKVTVEPEALEECAAAEVAAENALLERIAQLEVQLAEAEQKAAEYLDSLQRSQAALANYRKRTEAEQISWRSVANAALLARLLPILDDFERAFQALPADYKGQAWLDGIALIQRKIAGILEAENVRRIVVQPGDTFDPLYHQAVLHQEVAGFEEGQIVAEVEAGYMLGERVLRPVAVVVAKAPAVSPPPEPEVVEMKTPASPPPAGEVQAEVEKECGGCEEESGEGVNAA